MSCESSAQISRWSNGEWVWDHHISKTGRSEIFSKFSTLRMFGIELRTWCSNFTTIQRWMSPRSSFLWNRKIWNTFQIPNGENVWNWVANLVLKFHEDLTVNESEIVIFLKQVWWYVRKWEGFERRRWENEIERKRRYRVYRQSILFLFIARVLTTYYLLYLFIFYYFIKKNSILFPIKWINQIFFYFHSNHYFNTIISPYLFNHKNLTIYWNSISFFFN